MPLSFVVEPVRVRVPATSANLGPGFDALGLALSLHDEVEARVIPTGCQVEVTGAGADELPTDETHLVVRAMHAGFDVLGGRPTGLAVRCVNRIPQARGLGSSSAAIVAGVLLARALVVDGPRRMDDAAALRLAADLEGHPDNVAPCLLGGFTIAWNETPVPNDPAASEGRLESDRVIAVTDGAVGPDDAFVPEGAFVPDGAIEGRGAERAHPERAHPEMAHPEMARAVSLPVAPAVRPTVFVPEFQGLTAVARAALPASVPHPDAACNAGRAALLVHALTADPTLLFPATEDRLHQGYRAAGMPGTAALLALLREAGVAAVISGAGPTVLALTDPPTGFDPGMGWAVKSLSIDVSGAQVYGGTLGHAERAPVAAGRKS